MRRLILSVCSLAVMLTSTSALAFDKEVAAKLNSMFSQLTPQVVAKKPCMVTVPQLLKMIKRGEKFVILDVRTPAEQRIYRITLPNTLLIPMNEVFKEENLKKLPTDGKIIVVCHTGARAIAVATGLRLAGFKNAYVLAGGMKAVAEKVGRKAYLFVK